MATEDFITELFDRVDVVMHDVPKHPQSSLYPSAIVTLALLFALQGVGSRACYRGLRRDSVPVFPRVPPRTRLFRLFAAQQTWADRLLADPTVLGVADSYGSALLHPMREGRRPQQIGKTGQSHHRWIVGGKLGYLVNHWGVVGAWECATANVHETPFHPRMAQCDATMVVCAATPVHAQAGAPPNLKVGPRGTWNVRMVIETVLSRLTTVCHFKKVGHRMWQYFQARLAFTMALFNVLGQWHGLEPDDDGFIHLSIAEFSL